VGGAQLQASRFGRKRLRAAVEEVNYALSAVAGAIEEDLYEKFASGLRDPTEYREWLEEALEDACDVLSLDEKTCDSLVKIIREKYLEAEARVSIKIRVRYEDFLRALYEAIYEATK